MPSRQALGLFNKAIRKISAELNRILESDMEEELTRSAAPAPGS